MKKTITLGQFLDLIDSNRYSEEHINIMDGGNGEVLVRGMVCYDAWEENRLINSISINEDCEYMVWLEPRDGESKNEAKDERYIHDCLSLLKNIQDCGDCNVCASKKDCQYAPKVGQMVRYNCPFYKKESEKND